MRNFFRACIPGVPRSIRCTLGRLSVPGSVRPETKPRNRLTRYSKGWRLALRECRAHEEFVAHQAVLKVRLLPANISKRWLRARQQKTLMKILLQSKETRD